MGGTFMDKSFSVGMAGDQQYRDNWEATFGKRSSDGICDACNAPTKLELYVSETRKALEEAPEPEVTTDSGRLLVPECNCHTVNVGDQEHHQFWCARLQRPGER
jgi:hypothetical protein